MSITATKFKFYATPEQADAYHALRPSAAAWAALSAQDKAARLTAASDYIDAAYRFRGSKTDPNQLRQFPRNSQTDIPPAVVQAACELAAAMTDGGAAAAAATVHARKRVKVGEIETEYAVTDSASGSRRFPLIDGLLRDWIIPDGLRCGAITVGRFGYGRGF